MSKPCHQLVSFYTVFVDCFDRTCFYPGSDDINILFCLFVGWTVNEVAQHNTRDDCWMIIDGKAYDVTPWIDSHPGGDVILSYAGMDATVC